MSVVDTIIYLIIYIFQYKVLLFIYGSTGQGDSNPWWTSALQMAIYLIIKVFTVKELLFTFRGGIYVSTFLYRRARAVGEWNDYISNYLILSEYKC